MHGLKLTKMNAFTLHAVSCTLHALCILHALSNSHKNHAKKTAYLLLQNHFQPGFPSLSIIDGR
jgi:hypothetical protein